MSYFTKQAQKPPAKKAVAATSKKPMQKPLPNNNKQGQQLNGYQNQREEPEGKLLNFTEDEVVFIENVFVELETMIPNDQGENQEIMEKITTCQQIISARLDTEAGMIGDSA